MSQVRGFHHVTGVCGPPQENIDFYCGVLGLRLLKCTTNYDDPAAYHLYYGDRTGRPGSLLTFFPYPEGYPGRPGRQHVNLISLSIPRDAIAFWVDRFRQFEVEFDKPHHRDGGQFIGFRAPDGLPLELIATSDSRPGEHWPGSPIAEDLSVGLIRSITMVVDDLGPSSDVLTEVLGAEASVQKDGRTRFHFPGDPFAFVELGADLGMPEGRGGHGSVHHVAFRVETEDEQMAIRERVIEMGLRVSNVLDRNYFKSIYFREPGGVLLEVATDGPGFLIDESEAELGTSLVLPEQFEPLRTKIARGLPPVRLPGQR